MSHESTGILSLPTDVFIVVMQYLSPSGLAALSGTCVYLHAQVHDFGWKIWLRLNPRHSNSLSKALVSWSPREQVRYHSLTDRHWSRAEFIARPLSQRWTAKLQPLLAMNNSRLFVAAGNAISSFIFSSAHCNDVSGLELECVYTTSDSLQARRDITSLAVVPDNGYDRTLYVGFADGTLERIILPPHKKGQNTLLIESTYRTKHFHHGFEVVESISTSSTQLLSLSSSGLAAVHALQSTPALQSLLHLDVRSWSSYLSPSSSYAALGTSSVTPLTIHPILSTELSAHPSAVLASDSPPDAHLRSAVYAITRAPPSSPWGASDQMLISGWYDGVVRVHDMRAAQRVCASATSSSPASLKPVLTLYDPWSCEPIYAVSAGGGTATHIAAGSARHGVVAFWDVRAANRGWSVHAPGNDSSPVYSLIIESSRVFGATQSRPFVCDFGPGVREDMYPTIIPARVNQRDDGLRKRDRTGVGFYVTKYSHNRHGFGLNTEY